MNATNNGIFSYNRIHNKEGTSWKFSNELRDCHNPPYVSLLISTTARLDNINTSWTSLVLLAAFEEICLLVAGWKHGNVCWTRQWPRARQNNLWFPLMGTGGFHLLTNSSTDACQSVIRLIRSDFMRTFDLLYVTAVTLIPSSMLLPLACSFECLSYPLLGCLNATTWD